MKSTDIKLHVNAVDLLHAEYTSIWNLCESYRASFETETSPNCGEIAQELCRTVSLCNLIEQEVLYPEVRKVNEQMIFGLLLAHDEINACITEIRGLTPEDMDYDLEVRRLTDIVQAHIRTSERMLFPLIEWEIPLARLRPLAVDFMSRSLLLRILNHGKPAQRATGVRVPLVAHTLPLKDRGAVV